MEKVASNVSDIVLPQEVVELQHLKMRDGTPVRVTCEGLDELTLLDLTGGLSGQRPAVDTQEAVAALGGDEAVARMRQSSVAWQACPA